MHLRGLLLSGIMVLGRTTLPISVSPRISFACSTMANAQLNQTFYEKVSMFCNGGMLNG